MNFYTSEDGGAGVATSQGELTAMNLNTIHEVGTDNKLPPIVNKGGGKVKRPAEVHIPSQSLQKQQIVADKPVRVE